MAKLKRKAEDEDDIETLRRPRRKLYEPPATRLVDNPIAMVSLHSLFSLKNFPRNKIP
jgi:hypothetical protein